MTGSDRVRPEPLDPSQPGVTRWLRVPGDWRRAGDASGYDIFWRAVDAYGQLLPRPAAEDIAAFYDVDAYYTHRAGSAAAKPDGRRGLAWRALRHLAWRADRGIEPDPAWWRGLLGSRPRRCLEIGCGSGATLEMLAGFGHTVVGVEPDPAARAQAERRGVDVHPGTAEDLPDAAKRGRFDLVIFMHVLEHCLDPASALRNARDLLAEDGLIVVETPNNLCRGATHYGNAWLWLDIPRHLNFFSESSLGAALKSAGLRVVSAEHRGYARQFSDDWLDQQAVIARAFGRRTASELADCLRYFLATCFAGRRRKYDSIRVVGTPRSPGLVNPIDR